MSPDLSFEVEGAAPLTLAAAPMLCFALRVTNAEPKQHIHNVLLQCQIQIESTRRTYNSEEQQRLADLFGEPHRWGDTLRAMLWTHASVTVPPFSGSTLAHLQVPCSFDFNVAATKYFYALEDDVVPLALLFSGTVFFAAEEGLQISRIPWEKEAKYRLPVAVWKQMMESYYPNSNWLCLRRDVFARLYQFKQRQSIATWEQALERLLDAATENVSP